MQDTPRVLTANDISLGGFGIGISLGLQPRKIPTPLPPHEIWSAADTLRECCHSIICFKPSLTNTTVK